MRVVFQKKKRGLCWWTAFPPKRRPVSAMGGGSTGRVPIPHDLAQLVIERELGLRHGFWGCVADGASFRTLVGGGRKRTLPGVEIIRAHVAEIDAAEHEFHHHLDLYRRGEDSSTRAALDEVLVRWRSLSEHESFELDFPVVAAPRQSGRTRTRARGRRV